MKLAIPFIFLLTLLLFVSGCGTPKPTPRAYNYTLQIAPEIANRTIRVDLIGVTQMQWDRLSQYPISRYWEPGNKLRTGLRKRTLLFGQGMQAKQTFSSKNLLWKKWLKQGASYILLIADLPGVFEDKPGLSDFRRLQIPLDENKWNDDDVKTIEIQIKAGQVSILTAMNLENGN